MYALCYFFGVAEMTNVSYDNACVAGYSDLHYAREPLLTGNPLK